MPAGYARPFFDPRFELKKSFQISLRSTVVVQEIRLSGMPKTRWAKLGYYSLFPQCECLSEHGLRPPRHPCKHAFVLGHEKHPDIMVSSLFMPVQV